MKQEEPDNLANEEAEVVIDTLPNFDPWLDEDYYFH
jgi:hypothetical protein